MRLHAAVQEKVVGLGWAMSCMGVGHHTCSNTPSCASPFPAIPARPSQALFMEDIFL